MRYVDRTTDADIADPKIVDNQKVGATVTEEAVESENYDLDDDSVKTLTLQNGENEIIFYYKPAVANYTVRYVDVTDGGYVDIIAPENETGYVGQKITKTRKLFEGYKFCGSSTRASVTLTRNEDKNVITFEYEQQI